MLDQVLSFIAVAKAAGYTKAAKQTGISKAKLSRHVKELEARLGKQLLHRTTRAFALTEEGRRFYDSCQEIETIYYNAIEGMDRDPKLMTGTLRITAPIDFGIWFFEPIISEFKQTFPNINLRLSLTNVNEAFLGEEYDLAIRIANELPDSNLRATKVMSFKRIVCATPDYLKQHPKLKSPEDLKNHPCTAMIVRNTSVIKPRWQFYIKDKLTNISLDNVVETDSLLLQKELVLAGTCISRLPDYYLQEELQSGKLVEVFPKIKKPTTHVYVMYPDTIALPHKSRAFIDLLKQHLAD